MEILLQLKWYMCTSRGWPNLDTYSCIYMCMYLHIEYKNLEWHDFKIFEELIFKAYST